MTGTDLLSLLRREVNLLEQAMDVGVVRGVRLAGTGMCTSG